MERNGGSGKPLILITDDDPFIVRMFREVLKNAGFRCAAAESGGAAVEAVRKLRPDLVLLDRVMPGMDGIATCRTIRSLPEGGLIPILMVTARDDTESIHAAFEAGATDFFPKPVHPDLLVHRVRYLLRSGGIVKRLAESEERLAQAQWIARLGNWEWNPMAGTFWGSDETFRILGLSPGRNPAPFDAFVTAVYPPDREGMERALRGALKSGESRSFECRIKGRDPNLQTVRLQARPGERGGGKVPRMVGTIQDVTEMKRVEEHLRMLKEAVDSLPVGITVSDFHGRIIYTNAAEAAMHGYTIEELALREAPALAPAHLRSPLSAEKLLQKGPWTRESINLRKNGETFPVQLSSIALTTPQGKCVGVVTACEDITHRKEAEEKVRCLAYHDALTGLPNRQAFHDRLAHALQVARREGRGVGLLFLDLDNFKDINDTRGHDFGDKVLVEVGERLSATMRGSDTLARLGGDEFVVILSSLAVHEDAAMAARRVLGVFDAPFVIDGHAVYSSASIGISLFPDDGPDAETLCRCADTAMYEAKRVPAAAFRFFRGDMNRRVQRRVAIEEGIRRGLDNDEFVLLYQPRWDARKGIAGVEALIRWESRDFGLLLPREFLPEAEKTGLIFRIGEWALRRACLQARDWEAAGHPMRVAVNVSGRQLKHPDFVDMVRRVVEETAIPPGRLELEFTESVVMEKAERSTAVLGALKEMGLRLCIDGFGTGCSSLSSLKSFPVDAIKIDRSFVAGIDRDGNDAAIVDAILLMAHALGLEVTAVGVENREQLDFLTARHCDGIQGHYLAPAAPADALLRGVKRSRRKAPLPGLLPVPLPEC